MTLNNPHSTQSFIAKLPKVELHVHLEGSIEPELWLRLIQRNDPSQEKLTTHDLLGKLNYSNFDDFVQVYIQVIQALKEPEDFYHLTLGHLKKSAAQQIQHTETMFTPWFFTRNKVRYEDMMSEIVRAAKEAEQRWGITMNLIFDGPRNFLPAIVQEVFEMAAGDKTGLVVGVGIGGDEKKFPAKWYQKEFEYAKALGLRRIVHAGETDGESSILNAIQILGAERIGHALGIGVNSKVEEILIKKGVTLDLCPWSNVATNSVEAIKDHPFMEYYNRNYPITLNSDDPSLFKTSLNKEFETMAQLHGLTADQLSNLSLMAVKGSFLSENRKSEISANIRQCLKDWEMGV